MIVTLGETISGAKSDAILGIADRAKIIDYIKRGLELAVFKANWDVWSAWVDVCSDACGLVTLPSFVGTVLEVNVGGRPTVFRNRWFEYHINGYGSQCGSACGYSDDAGRSPVFQDLTSWSVVAAICEDPIDGNGSLSMIVEGETMDAQLNVKEALTIPATGPSSRGVRIPLLTGVANTDAAITYFRKITQVTKPVTRGYVKLIAFPIKQMALSVNIGYYDPTETNPTYRRIKVGATCKWVRIHYRRASIVLRDDHDIVPISSYNAMLDLLKAVRLSDSNNIDASEAYLAKAVRLLTEIQSIENDTPYAPMKVMPGWGIGTLDPR